MADNALKTPFASALNRFAEGKAADAIQRLGKALPCTVAAVSATGSQIVTVNFEVNAAPFLLPQVTVPQIGPEWIRYPTQVGDKGFVIPADVYLGGMSGLGGGTANLVDPGNLSSLVFAPIGNTLFGATPNGSYLFMYGKTGVQIMSRFGGDASITLTDDVITIALAGGCTMRFEGTSISVTGGDLIVGGISVMTHVHGDVMAGSSNTGPPE